MTLAEQVAARWHAEGVAMDGPGVDDATLDAIERAHDVKLPASLRALWSICDGTCAQDHHGVIFLQAGDLLDPRHGHRDGASVALTFADWRLGTALVVRLAPDDRGVHAVDHADRAIAPTFDAFLARWLRDEPLG